MEWLSISINFTLLLVAFGVLSSVILGAIVLSHNLRSITARSFFAFTVVSALWGLVTYFQFHVRSEFWVLSMIRLIMFFAIWQAYTFFLMAYVFPDESKPLPRGFKYVLTPIVIVVSLITLTPFVYSDLVSLAPEGEVSKAIPGPGILTFTLTAISLVAGGLVYLAKRRKQAEGIQKIQFRYFSIGIIIMFSLIIVLNFLLPNAFGVYKYVPFGAIFTLPFIIFTSYTILKHHLLNIKVVATEILVFFLLSFFLLDVFLSKDSAETVFKIVLFAILLVLSFFLIKSVVREVKQREELQSLTSKLQDANKKLKALDVARQEFISIASHQLRTPPATIKWYLASILAGDFGPLSKDLREALAKTEGTNNGLISLIEDLLNVSRIERGKLEFFFEPAQAEDLVQSAYDQLVPIAKEKGLEFTYKKPSKPLPTITLDKEKLKQVINNLMDNAIKYTTKGFVHVEIGADAKYISIKVSDSGKGVTESDKKDIFQKYKRGDNAHHHSMGLGLGLYVAKIVIHEHNGKIWVESEGENKGSTFIITLPIKNKLKPTSLVDLTATNI